MDRKPHLKPDAIGKRLEALRLALGKIAAEVCRDTDFAPHAWSQWENGKVRLSLDSALVLCERYDVTLDYIFRGSFAGLPLDLAEKVKKKLIAPVPAADRRQKA